MSVQNVSLSIPQKRHFYPTPERLEELKKRKEKNNHLLKTQGLNSALKNAVYNLGDDIGKYGFDHEHTAIGFNHLGALCKNNGYLDEYYNLNKLSHNIIKRNSDNISYGILYNNMSVLLSQKGKYQKSVEYALHALEFYKNNPDIKDYKKRISKNHFQLGSIYSLWGDDYKKKGNYQEAHNMYSKAYTHALEGEKLAHEMTPDDAHQKEQFRLLKIFIKQKVNKLSAPPEWWP